MDQAAALIHILIFISILSMILFSLYLFFKLIKRPEKDSNILPFKKDIISFDDYNEKQSSDTKYDEAA